MTSDNERKAVSRIAEAPCFTLKDGKVRYVEDCAIEITIFLKKR